jgi:methyl-accepting chemotaxis protein
MAFFAKILATMDLSAYGKALNRTQSIVELTHEGMVRTANEKFLTTLGYSLLEVKGRSHRMMIEPSFVASPVYQSLWERLGRGESESGLHPYLGKDGKEVWLHAWYVPMGKPGRVVVFATQGTAIQTELEQTREELKVRQDIMDLTSIVSEANLKGDIMSANDKFLQVSKYPKDELVGHGHNTTRHPDMPKEVFKQMWATIGRGQIFRGVVKNRAKDGTPYYVDAVIAPFMDKRTGKPRKYLGVRYDLTETEIARHNMKGILEGINRTYAMIEFTLDGTVLTANENFLTTMDYTLNEIKGRHHRMFCDPAYTATGEYSAFWTRLNRGDFDAGVYRRLGKGGKEVWLQATYCPVMDEMGRPFKVVKLATDITAQKRAQNEVQTLIRAAAEGHLSERIRTDGMIGAGKELAESFNQLLDAVATPMHDAMMAMTALAGNDLTKPMTGNYQGEFGQMKASCNGGLIQLTQTLVMVREAVEAVSSGAEQITKGNEDLAQRTSEQASALEETSASMEEMTSTVKQNADNAKQANQLAVAARDTADKGGSVTKKAVDAMGEINKSSKKIADIITVIDEIAFQTNLLALNAAVEAARAGEHGRGFAVVAAEVRNLAQRSATAAKEIKGLINESIQRVNDGSELVNQSGKTLEEIVTSVKRVTDIIAEITAASQEQASGIDQVNKAIMSMDETTQQNAALVEETTSASQSLKVQATELRQRVLRFKVEVTEADKASMPSVQGLGEFVAHTIHDAYDGTGELTARAHKPVAAMKKSGMGTPRPAREAKVPTAAVAGKGEHRRTAAEGFKEF